MSTILFPLCRVLAGHFCVPFGGQSCASDLIALKVTRKVVVANMSRQGHGFEQLRPHSIGPRPLTERVGAVDVGTGQEGYLVTLNRAAAGLCGGPRYRARGAGPVLGTYSPGFPAGLTGCTASGTALAHWADWCA